MRVSDRQLDDTPEAGGYAGTLLEGLDAALAAPILAGMRARAVAEACEAQGVAAVLIDRTGNVLHATSHTAAYLGGVVAIVSGRMASTDEPFNRELRALLSLTLGEGADQAGRGFLFSDHGRSRRLSAHRFWDRSPTQRLHAVVVFTPGEVFDPSPLWSGLVS